MEAQAQFSPWQQSDFLATAPTPPTVVGFPPVHPLGYMIPPHMDASLGRVPVPSYEAQPCENRDSHSYSPQKKASSGYRYPEAPKAEQDKTTVMLRNLPNDYTRNMLIEFLRSRGFGGSYDFVYLPFDFKKKAGLGYAFMNLISHSEALRAMRELPGFREWKLKSHKVLEVSWSTPLQGLSANIERYRNSPVMHPDVPEHFKPLIIHDGAVVPFPLPTKALQVPSSGAEFFHAPGIAHS
jgi:hypothetical protein